MTHTQLSALVLAPSSVEDRSSEFVPVTGGGESTSAQGLLIFAYILMWACAFGLIWMSIKKLSLISARMDELEAKLAQKDNAHQASNLP